MSLQEKILSLKLEAVIAARHAAFWSKLIAEHGEEKTTAFYTHLGLNHLEKKSVTWEGLTLSREPTEAEKLCVKGIAGAQESAKEKLTSLLTNLRTKLISDGLEGINKLDPAKYHQLVLDTPAEFRTRLRDRLIKVHHEGRLLVAAELGTLPLQKGKHIPGETELKFRELGIFIKQDEDEDEFDELDILTDVTDSRISNDVQSRVIAAAARFTLLGLVGAALLGSVREEVETGSVSYIDRAATGLANKVINIGRGDEARDRRDEWGRVEYSALLDQNVCGPCAEEDGDTANDEDDLTPVPNPDCEGGDWCRCFHVFIADGDEIEPFPEDDDDPSVVAERMANAARVVEPGITSDLKDIAGNVGGKMEGLDFRIKTQQSLARKIAAEARDAGIPPSQVQIGDSLRYTMVFDDSRFAKGSQGVLDSLRAQGYEVSKVKHYWEGNEYKGTNTNLVKSGTTFELQFHTPTSLLVKESESHPLYEKIRVSTDEQERAELNAELRRIWANVNIPVGATEVKRWR